MSLEAANKAGEGTEIIGSAVGENCMVYTLPARTCELAPPIAEAMVKQRLECNDSAMSGSFMCQLATSVTEHPYFMALSEYLCHWKMDSFLLKRCAGEVVDGKCEGRINTTTSNDPAFSSELKQCK